MVDLIAYNARSHPTRLSAGVFIVPPMHFVQPQMATVCSCLTATLLVAISLTLGVEYLHFFSHCYAHLCFNEDDGADKAGHFTILAV